MKSIKQLILLAGLTGGLFASMTVRAADAVVTNATPEAAAADGTNAPSQTAAQPVAADQTPQPPPATVNPPRKR